MSFHKNFLDDEDVLTIRPRFAAFLGLNESVVVQQLHYWLKKAEKGQCGRFVEGHYWVWNNISEWLDQFPFFSDSTLKRIFSSLKKNGIIHVEQFDGAKRTNFYRIDYPNLDKFLENAQKRHEVKMTSCGKTPSVQNDPLEEVKMTPSSGQNDLMYTETTPETASEIINTPPTPRTERQEGNKKPENKKTPTLADIADQHHMTISTIEDFVEFRLNSGGIENPIAFKKHVLRGLAEPYSDESVHLEEWFEAIDTQSRVIDHLVAEFSSMHWFDRRKCREQAKDDFVLKMNNVTPTDVVIEIAYQRAESKRREQIGGAA